LIFLGEVDNEQAAKVKEKLAEIKFEPFSITYTGVGAFPSPGNVRVVWVGVGEQDAQKMAALAQKVVAKMADVGFKPDKPFSPHLTILRAKNRHVSVDVARYAGRTFGTALVDRVHLKKSELSPAGPTYSNVYTVNAAKEQA
jgi:2'-5' RNA ligase